ncbi:MAG TPA: PIN domain-containing protein [Thermoanaerobaculia bacterium]|jgi:predicted nucleic acid-binding protein
MPTFFADTWFFVALLDRRDSHHKQAERLALQVVPRGTVVTHDAVLTEVLTYFADGGAWARQHAVEGIRNAVLQFDVIPGDRPLFIAALALYAARPDKEYSLVDCMSMVVMEERGIRHVLTNDHHFTQAGFVVVNE